MKRKKLNLLKKNYKRSIKKIVSTAKIECIDFCIAEIKKIIETMVEYENGDGLVKLMKSRSALLLKDINFDDLSALCNYAHEINRMAKGMNIWADGIREDCNELYEIIKGNEKKTEQS